MLVKFIVTFFISILIAFTFSKKVEAISFNSSILSAEKNYKEKNYNKAYEDYKKAQIDEPSNKVLKYNLGNTAYKLGKYEDAENVFKNLAKETESKELKQKSTYNLGNAYYKQAKLEEAEKAYEEALKLDGNDLSAKKNLEKVREELKKRKKDEQDRKDNQKKNKNSNKDKSDKNSNSKNNMSQQLEQLGKLAKKLKLTDKGKYTFLDMNIMEGQSVAYVWQAGRE